jgi:hypothetical protein
MPLALVLAAALVLVLGLAATSLTLARAGLAADRAGER